MANYVSLLQFTDQGIRAVKDSPKRAEAARALGEKMGVKVADVFWTLGAYDLVLVLEAANDEAVTAFTLSLGALGNVKTQTMRAFRSDEFKAVVGKIRQ